MPTCAVLGCTSGYISNSEKVSFFRVPNNQVMIKQWQNAIRRKDIVLSSKLCICEKHFLKQEILWQREIRDQSGNILGVSSYKIPRLKAGTVPSVFPWTENIDIDSSVSTIPELMEVEENSSPRVIEINNEIKKTVLNIQYLININIDMPSASWCRMYNAANNILYFFESICCKIKSSYSIISLKEIIITDNMRITVKALSHLLDIGTFGMIDEPINDVSQLQNLLMKIDGMKICSAYQRDAKLQNVKSNVLFEDTIGMTRHNNCPILLSDDKICRYCGTAKKILQRIAKRAEKHDKNSKLRIPLSPKKRKYFEEMRRKKKLADRSKQRALKSIKKWKIDLNKKEAEIKLISQQQIENELEKSNIGINEREVIKQILAALKRKSPKGRRYSEHWLLLCLLMHMRSPCGYRFLRENDILPIPAVRTIRRYLSIIDTKCGFDANFLELFKIFIEKKEEINKHGALLIDEMSTRQSVSVKTQNLTYTGLVDFGENGPQSSNVYEKANHALTMMFQPFADNYTQLIAVFASSGPVNGEIISQLIIKAIILLEKAGAKVHAVISDGASTNRKFWATMGVKPDRCNLINYFQHPVAENRKVFVFSDTPHLMKTIRNRLYNNLKLQMDPNQSQIKWDFLKIMHDNDKLLPGQMRICPKLTEKHLNLSNSAKMRVRLAVQVFSKSVARGLRFYQTRIPELRDSEATADFCEWMNNMFDALNRREYLKGLKPGNPDFKILEESLSKLDDWEKKVDDKILDKDLFLTKQTAEGLRITLKSMMDLTCTLVNDFGFSELLSGRVN